MVIAELPHRDIGVIVTNNVPVRCAILKNIFAQLRETYILGSQSAFEHGKEITVADVIDAIELQAARAQDLKTSISASEFVRHTEPSAG